MRILLGFTLLAAAFWASGNSCRADIPTEATGSPSDISTEALKKHTQTLADDALRGREAGKPGGRAAASYILGMLKLYDLLPAGEEGYVQTFGRGYRNLIAKVPGTDPDLADEHILLTAHYDHVGLGSKANSKGAIGVIHNGADDNASGVAAVLEVAKALTQQDNLQRTVLIIFWDAEEKGLLGSKHWLQNPTIEIDSVRYMVNVDMVGRLREKLMLFGTRTMPGLRLAWARANTRHGISLDFPWEVINNSDHYTFFQEQIPITMVHTGLHDDYHRSSDDVHLLNQDGIKQTVGLLTDIITGTANEPALPAFRKQSLNERASGQRYFERPFREQQRRLGLTVTPAKGKKGLQVDAVWVGSPANKAGLQPGMQLLSANGQSVSSAAELRSQILQAEESMKVGIVEGDTPRDVTVRLAGKPQRIGVSWRDNDAEPDVVMLSGVVPNSPAAIAGCQPLDRVVKVGDKPVGDSGTFREAMQNLTGETQLLLERDGKLLSVKLVLPEGDD